MAKKKNEEKEVDLKEVYEKYFNDRKRPEPEVENLFKKDPQWAYLYAKYIRGDVAKLPNNGAWDEEDEKVFFDAPKWAYLYCIFIHKSPAIVRQMMAKAIANPDDEWTKKFFDPQEGVDATIEGLKE